MCVGVDASVLGLLFTRSRGLNGEVSFRGIPILMPSEEGLAPDSAATLPDYGYGDVVELLSKLRMIGS
jgi:hypothetical protein